MRARRLFPMLSVANLAASIAFYVEDVDEAVAAARAARVEVVLEPADQPWGERIAYVADPDGNLVMLTA